MRVKSTAIPYAGTSKRAPYYDIALSGGRFGKRDVYRSFRKTHRVEIKCPIRIRGLYIALEAAQPR